MNKYLKNKLDSLYYHKHVLNKLNDVVQEFYELTTHKIKFRKNSNNKFYMYFDKNLSNDIKKDLIRIFSYRDISPYGLKYTDKYTLTDINSDKHIHKFCFQKHDHKHSYITEERIIVEDDIYDIELFVDCIEVYIKECKEKIVESHIEERKLNERKLKRKLCR